MPMGVFNLFFSQIRDLGAPWLLGFDPRKILKLIFKYLCAYIWKSYDSNPSGWSLEYYSEVLEINQQLKGVHNRVKMGNIKWDSESQILEVIVITILNLSKTISTHKGNVEMPNFSMVCFFISKHNVPKSEFKHKCL